MFGLILIPTKISNTKIPIYSFFKNNYYQSENTFLFCFVPQILNQAEQEVFKKVSITHHPHQLCHMRQHPLNDHLDH